MAKSLISSIVHGACLVIYCRYAVTLSRNNGLMQTPAKIQSRKRKGSPGPSAPRPQTPGPAQPGPVPVGRIQAKRMHCNDATGQWSSKTWRYMGCSTTGWRETNFSYHLICFSYLHRIRYRQIPLSLSITVGELLWYAMTWPDNSWYRGQPWKPTVEWHLAHLAEKNEMCFRMLQVLIVAVLLWELWSCEEVTF